MECPKCGADNAPLKKTCQNCGAVLSGWTVNNVTGEFGFRNPDGSFTKEPKVSEAIPHKADHCRDPYVFVYEFELVK